MRELSITTKLHLLDIRNKLTCEIDLYNKRIEHCKREIENAEKIIKDHEEQIENIEKDFDIDLNKLYEDNKDLAKRIII
ncbi:hypothetical protein EXN48_14460 [Clostridium botulinum]|nr:hypothetical protein [Clostridium botulinum]NFC90721.1 hypothetical protein [Clostridium botulinum]NFC99606.1 hypothetical protein [Clostridium botulinum]NFD38451.1 hypothetical protein [Clostridium botulinum]NFD42118.1 hypothetical protein [Clostridium botulinum]